MFQNEAIAIEKAIQYINENYRNKKIQIITDSRAVLKALQQNKRKREITERIIDEWTRSVTEIKIKWKRAHVEELGNKEADKARETSGGKNCNRQK